MITHQYLIFSLLDNDYCGIELLYFENKNALLLQCFKLSRHLIIDTALLAYDKMKKIGCFNGLEKDSRDEEAKIYVQ